ncbi:MAG: hypothetical protein J6V09_04045 [Clostridia bacterium]|nr:hypothetical protein [Clostridia bacterium]
MNMFDEAQALRTMIIMCGLTQAEIARRMGVSQSYVANKLRLLNFPEEVREKINEAKITERHARALLKLPDSDMQREVIDKIRSMRLPVRATEALIDDMLIDKKAALLFDNATRERVRCFEDMLSAAVKGLVSYGIKVRQDTDEYCGKRFITLCIDDG